jgi:hypothetical protein
MRSPSAVRARVQGAEADTIESPAAGPGRTTSWLAAGRVTHLLVAVALAACGVVTPSVAPEDRGEAAGGPPVTAEAIADSWLRAASRQQGDDGWSLLYPSTRTDLFGSEERYRAEIEAAEWSGFGYRMLGATLHDGEYQVRVELDDIPPDVLLDWGLMQMTSATVGFVVVRIGVGSEASGVQAVGGPGPEEDDADPGVATEPPASAPADRPTGPPPTAPPATPATGALDLTGPLTCGEGSGVTPPSAVLAQPPVAEQAATEPARALVAYLATPDAAEQGYPASGWRAAGATPGRVAFIAPGDDGWWFVAVEDHPDQGGWQAWEYGRCALQVQLPAGIGFASWELDPAAPPVPGATSVTILATEIACASGRQIGGRLLAPVVLASAEAITIAITVRRLPGGQDCQGAPPTHVTVDLGEPLGGRGLFDGSSTPAVRR